jgi:hypothetical protein
MRKRAAATPVARRTKKRDWPVLGGRCSASWVLGDLMRGGQMRGGLMRAAWMPGSIVLGTPRRGVHGLLVQILGFGAALSLRAAPGSLSPQQAGQAR